MLNLKKALWQQQRRRITSVSVGLPHSDASFVSLFTCKQNQVTYLREEMLDDGGQSLHSLISLHEQPPQLADGLVLLLCLLFALVLFRRRRSICRRCAGCDGLGGVLQAGPSSGAGSGGCSCFEPNTRGSSGGISNRRWEDWRHWWVSIHCVGYLAIRSSCSTRLI